MLKVFNSIKGAIKDMWSSCTQTETSQHVKAKLSPKSNQGFIWD